jgi:RNA polymerase sigma-70 factor (ECF subfamily)
VTVHHLARPVESRPPNAAAELRDLAEVYEAHFDFVWRSLRRLGVPVSALDDAAHDVFLVVHRKLPEFEGRSALKTWLFSIALRVAQNTRRACAKSQSEELDDNLADSTALGPDELTLRAESVQLGYRLLNQLDEGKRAVFILAELEQLPAAEIALALDIPMYTVYSRLRAARREFDAALLREQARFARRDRWTT